MKRIQFIKMMVGMPLGLGAFAARELQKYERGQECLLNKFYVAGFQYYQGPVVIEQIEPQEFLTLSADPKSKYDQFAVAIYRGDMMMGHVPKSDNKHLSRLLQQGVKLSCQVAQVNPKREAWKMLKVHVYL